ncbi:TPA: low molecular weight phosphotyrosine protein phosphatase, partial [Streptococcus suis]|nr:low molecular weight phosphotyrosine protein phosphatase [Streptococcus suis]
FDVIIGMDSNNVRDLRKMAPAHAQDKIFQFADKSVPDPWYTGDFQETYRMVKQGCQDWLDKLS